MAGVLVRRQLGRRLRALRDEAGLTRDDPRLAMVGKRAKIQMIEGGKARVRVPDVVYLCKLYGASEEVTDQLVLTAETAQQPGDDYGEAFGHKVVPEWFSLFSDLEMTAHHIRGYYTEFAPGLLQSEDYARAMIAADDRLTPDVVEQRVGHRMRRQAQVLSNDRKVTIILSEGVLHRVVGSPAVQEEQIRRMNQMVAMGLVTAKVLPWQSGEYEKQPDYVIFDCPEDEYPTTVYIEIPLGARYMEGAEYVAEMNRHFGKLMSKAVHIREFL